jgi:hypothetical protein
MRWKDDNERKFGKDLEGGFYYHGIHVKKQRKQQKLHTQDSRLHDWLPIRYKSRG